MTRRVGLLTEGFEHGCRSPPPAPRSHLAVFGDLLFGEYSNRLADSHARAGGRAFLSRFDRRRNGPHEAVRARHCADIPFAFGNLDTDCPAFLIGVAPTPADHDLSRRMVRAWADFAATRNPGRPHVAGSAAR
ncbi:carboxylesterase family protein [Streptomyces longwoodensis]|uniref:carboxylesterase family protein n=1 Tax=Streptomyces longwoodensis TaxID=68231 RepID=UPI0037BB8924